MKETSITQTRWFSSSNWMEPNAVSFQLPFFHRLILDPSTISSPGPLGLSSGSKDNALMIGLIVGGSVFFLLILMVDFLL